MFTSLNIGSAALSTYSKAMNTVSGNIANMNTAGYKGSYVEFAAHFSSGQGERGAANYGSQPSGVSTSSVVNFRAGDYAETRDGLHLGIDGNSFFVLKNPKGEFIYTRNGQFTMRDGYLVGEGGARVQGLDASGNLVDIRTVGELDWNPSATTTRLTHDPRTILSLSSNTATMQPFNVYDSSGGVWQLNVKYTRIPPTAPSTENKWKVEIMGKNETVLFTDYLVFKDGGLGPKGNHTSYAFTYTPSGTSTSISLTLDYSNLESISGPSSSVVQLKADGRARGSRTSQEFTQDGEFRIKYSNGEENKTQRIAMAMFSATDQLRQVDGGIFMADALPDFGRVGERGVKVKVGSVEKSNVDMSAEFAEMIRIQRSYQAVSQIVSTANQMIDNLMSMKRGG